MKIEMSDSPYPIDVKRFYFPARFIETCPECGKEVVKDGDGDYLSYPKLNEPFDVNFYCHSIDEATDKDIEHEFTRRVVMRLSFEALEG